MWAARMIHKQSLHSSNKPLQQSVFTEVSGLEGGTGGYQVTPVTLAMVPTNNRGLDDSTAIISGLPPQELQLDCWWLSMLIPYSSLRLLSD